MTHEKDRVIGERVSTSAPVSEGATNKTAEIHDQVVQELRMFLDGGPRAMRAVDNLDFLSWLSMKPLLSILRGDDAELRWAAALAMVTMDVADPAALDALVLTLQDEDGPIREAAADALWSASMAGCLIGHAVGDVLARVVRDDEDARVRSSAVRALWRIKPTEPASVGKALLTAVREDKDARVRVAAAEALWRVRPPTPAAVEALAAAVGDDPDAGVRKSAAESLGRIKALAAVPGLLATLPHEHDDEVRRSLCWALGEISAAAAIAAQAAAAAAAEAAAAVDALHDKVLPALSKVRDSDPSVLVRLQAEQELQELELEYGIEPDAVVSGPAASLPTLGDKMRAVANAARKQLDTFCLIGQVLREDKIETFTIGWMAQQLRQRYKLPIGASTIGDHLDKVENIFGKHLPGLGVLLDRGQGQRPAITPQWWEAWRIAMQIMGRLSPGGARGQAETA